MRLQAAVLSSLVLAGAVGAEPQPDQPRVGVVLSGGGALGAAHVGVLKVLEELRVPVHCVAGTSMGAIVGGLYAAGYSPQELEDLLVGMAWDDLLQDRPPRRLVPFRRKVDDLSFLTRLEVGFNRGSFQLPHALVHGQKLDFVLQLLTLHTVGIERFDDLPIPFRAVATDLETGAEVVLDHGDLGQAIRASMAVPGVFAPSTIGGRVLVDGGLVNNLPVDLARRMGADVVVAVDVGEPLRSREELKSITRVAGQVVQMAIRRNVNTQLAEADLVIFPDVAEFSAGDFHRSDELIPRGEQVARDASEDLGQYSVSEGAYAAFRSRVRRPEIAEPNVTSIQVTIDSRADPEFVLARIRTRPGDPLDPLAIARDLERLYAEGDYERVSFFLTREPGGYALHVDAQEKSWGPNVMRFGLNLYADLEGEGAFNALVNYTVTNLNHLRGEAKVTLQVGNQSRLTAGIYQPLHRRGLLFVSPVVEALSTNIHLPTAAGGASDWKLASLSGSLDLGLDLRRWGELRLGVLRGRARIRSRGVATEIPDLDTAGVRLRLILDQLDSFNFPKHGWFVFGELFSARESLGSENRYDRLEAWVFGAASSGRHALIATLAHDSALGTDLPTWEEFALGGLFHLSGYPPGAFSGRYLDFAMTSYYYQVADFGTRPLSGVHLGVSLEAGAIRQHRGAPRSHDLLWSGALYLAMDTYLGPVYLAYGRGEGRQDTWHLFLGRSF